MNPEQLYDVIAVGLPPNQPVVRLMATGKTLENAEAFVKMAVYRRGVDDEFFAEVLAGTYKEEDVWKGRKPEEK